MSKYIVKNCPCVSTSSENEPLCYECLNNNPSEPWRCMDRDCLIKQVIEKCRNYDKAILKDLMLFKSVRVIVRDILQLFEIKECEQ